ncbi:hypothetical protein J4E90_002958 [Alternaria incomplexa]|uniref:uncharacterized protein n=1 Tax=Alternaria incomplexa TaxID=1187928 RepID=UPI00221ED4BC|nr:uncharacterized protein J4E90_002958 [Alternaria incomplexa]KAI4918572.1 hypothetical protein J4E90_002958 [Alternaria incomplexa]
MAHFPPCETDAMIFPKDYGYRDQNFDNYMTHVSSGATSLFHGTPTPNFATSMVPVMARILPKDIRTFVASAGQIREVELAVRNVTHPDVSRLVREQSVANQIIYVVLHQLANDGTVTRAVDEPQTNFDFFLRTGIKCLFSVGPNILKDIINSTPPPYNLALIQNIFCIALILGDGFILGIVLDMGPTGLANRPVSMRDSLYYPLEYTSLRGDVQATKVLLDHGANPNQRTGPDFLLNIGRLPHTQKRNPKARGEIMRLLISADLEADPESVMNEMSCCDKSELLLLTTFYLDKSPEVFFHRRVLPEVLLRPDWDDSFSGVIKSILERASPDIIGHQDLWDAILSESLSSAVLRSNTSAVSILLAEGAKLDVKVLISAVRGNDLEILNKCLDQGLDPNAQAPKPIDGDASDGDCTGLSESIKNSSGEAFDLFKTRGYFQNLARQPAGFAAAFVAACEVGDDVLVEQILSLQKLQRRQAGIGRALEAAIERGNNRVLKRLLSVGISPTVRCLELAVRNKQLDTVKLLAECIDLPATLQADAWYYDHFMPAADEQHYGNAIIFEALRWGNQAAIGYVLRMEHPVNVLVNVAHCESHDWDLGPELQPPGTAPADWNLTPLSAAILKANPTAIKALMAHGAQVVLPHMFNSRFTAHQFNAHQPRTTPCQTDREGWSLTPLAAAVVRKDLSLIKEYLRIGADPFDNSALFVCAILRLKDVMELLLSAFRTRYPDGAQSFGSDALYQAMRRADKKFIRLLCVAADMTGRVANDRRPDRYTCSVPQSRTEFTSPLGEAIRMSSARQDGHDVLLELFLPLARDLNSVIHRDHSRGNMTALLYAISLGSLRTVQRLHKAGANISLPTSWSIPQTPLQAAAQVESIEIVKYLLMRGADPNEPAATRAGATALQSAAMTGNIGIATVLLEKGADINAEPALFDGKTAFEGATEQGRIEMMLFLVHCGADLLANNNAQYQRAVQFAEDNLQYAAKELAHDLFSKAKATQDLLNEVTANRETNSIDMDLSGWAGDTFEDFFA